MSNQGCFSCKTNNNLFCEVHCCGVRLCRFCVSKTRYCPLSGCAKNLKPSIQDVIMKKGYFDEVLVLNRHQNYSDRKYGFNPLELAITENDSYIVENLVKYGLCDKERSVMTMAIELYNLEIIKILKNNDFPFDYQSSLQLQDDFSFLTSGEADQVLRI